MERAYPLCSLFTAVVAVGLALTALLPGIAMAKLAANRNQTVLRG